MTDDALRDLIADHRNGILATIRKDGRPQQSVVLPLRPGARPAARVDHR